MRKRERIFISLSRKKRNAFLFGILFFLVFFEFVFLSVYQTTKESVSEIEEAYGTSFRIQIYRDESKPEFWEEKIVEGLDTPLRVYTGPNVDEDMMAELFEGMDMTIEDKIPTEFYCNCSKERVSRAVVSVGKKELTDMIEEGKPIEVNCHFCNSHYTFSVEELKEMLKAAR